MALKVTGVEAGLLIVVDPVAAELHAPPVLTWAEGGPIDIVPTLNMGTSQYDTVINVNELPSDVQSVTLRVDGGTPLVFTEAPVQSETLTLAPGHHEVVAFFTDAQGPGYAAALALDLD